MLWANETHLPAWPPGPADGKAARTARAALDVVRRLGTVRTIVFGAARDGKSGGDAA